MRCTALWAPCTRPLCARTGQKWGPRIGAPIIAGPQLRRGPLWATPPHSAPPPACTHPVGAVHAPGLRAHWPKMGAQNWRSHNRGPAFAAGATVGHTPPFGPATCVHAPCWRPARAQFGRAPAKNGGPELARQKSWARICGRGHCGPHPPIRLRHLRARTPWTAPPVWLDSSGVQRLFCRAIRLHVVAAEAHVFFPTATTVVTFSTRACVPHGYCGTPSPTSHTPAAWHSCFVWTAAASPPPSAVDASFCGCDRCCLWSMRSLPPVVGCVGADTVFLPLLPPSSSCRVRHLGASGVFTRRLLPPTPASER